MYLRGTRELPIEVEDDDQKPAIINETPGLL